MRYLPHLVGLIDNDHGGGGGDDHMVVLELVMVVGVGWQKYNGSSGVESNHVRGGVVDGRGRVVEVHITVVMGHAFESR